MHMITEYFKRELEAAGYDPSEHRVWWSLNYCQGDGMAFEAVVDLTKVGDRLLTGPQKAALRRIIEKVGPRVSISHSGHYYHYNSMSVNSDDGYYVEDHCTPYEQKVWCELIEAIEEDVKTLSRRLEKEGYKILEACNPAWFVENRETKFGDPSYAVWRTFNIGRFRVVQKLVEDTDYSIYGHEDVKDIVAGKIVVCGVEVTVFEAEDDIELGRASLWGISDTPELPYVKQCLREVTCEAIADARATIKRIAP